MLDFALTDAGELQAMQDSPNIQYPCLSCHLVIALNVICFAWGHISYILNDISDIMHKL